MLWGDMATKLQQLRHQLEDPANLRDASKAEPDLTSTPKAAAEPAKPVAKPKTLTLFAKLAKQEKPKTPKNKGIKLGFAEPKAPTLRPSSIRLTRVDDYSRKTIFRPTCSAWRCGRWAWSHCS